jgi:hypothetical protein
MRLPTAQSIADEGELEILGFRLPGESKQARAQCGGVPQLDNLDVTLPVQQNLLVFAHLYRIRRGDRPAAIERALELADLVDRRDTRVDRLSGGMRRRLPNHYIEEAELNPLHHTVQFVRGAAFGFAGWTDVLRVGFLIGFGLAMWRVAIQAMTRKLID